MEAELVYSSIEAVERPEPKTNMTDNAVESKTLLPAEKLLDLRQGFDALSERAKNRIALLEETLRATSFSEWADIFSIWLAEKKNTLSRYTKPSSVDMAQVRSGRGGEGRGRGEQSLKPLSIFSPTFASLTSGLRLRMQICDWL